MFQPSVPAFLDRARDLYTDRAFDVPPPPVPAPAVPADWQSYDGPDVASSAQWQQFRQSSRFLQVHGQWLDRLQDCERFALRHCSGKEARDVLDALKILRERLMQGYGEDYATSRITTLYGEGKRAMDHVCLRLAQDALELDFRRRHLREMAYQLHHCLSTGPAYVQAAAALDMPPHGLRSAFLTLVRQRSDDALRQAYLDDHRNDAAFYVRSMEVHGVNRMRLEYRLPGADPLDAISLGAGLFDPTRHSQHLAQLRQALAPCRLAEALAEQYWEQLLARLPPDVPGRASEDDLNDAMPLIQAAVTAVNTSLATVPMTSLMQIDERSDGVRWHRGNALLTRDLLLALEREQLVVTRPRTVLHRGKEDGLDWQLEAIDDQLFYVMECHPQQPTPVAVPFSRRHLIAIEASLGPRAPPSLPSAPWPAPPPPAAWLDIILHDTPSHELADIPAHWLARSHHLEAWLRRVDPDAFVRWVRTSGEAAVHPPETIVRTLTTQGRADLLQALMRSGPAPTSAWLQWAGPDILLLAVAAPSASTFALWRQWVAQALPTASPAKVSRWFTPVTTRGLLACAIETRQADRVAAVLAFIEDSMEAGVVPRDQLLRHLVCPVQMLLYQGRLDVLPLLGEFLVKACSRGWLVDADLQTYLGGKCPGWGCEGALASGQNETLRWYLDLVQRLQATGALPRSGLAALVGDASPEGHVVSHAAVLNNRSTTLGLFLDALIGHAQEGRVPVPLLQRQLTCDGADRSGLYTMVATLPDASCLFAWREAVHKACRLNLLSCADVKDLIGGTRFSRRPLLKPLLKEEALPPTQRWLATVHWLFERQALTTGDVVSLLRAEVLRVDLPPRPLFHQMMLNRGGMHHTTRYGFIVSFARHVGMISEADLEDLLRADNPDDHTPVLIDAVERGEHGVIDSFLQTLTCMTQAGHLPSAALVRLMDGRSPMGRSALATAARRRDVATLRLLLNHGIDCLRSGFLNTVQWFSLLAPDDDTDPPMIAVRTQGDATVTDQVLSTLQSAETLGMLTTDQRLLAASLLGVRTEGAGPPPDL